MIDFFLAMDTIPRTTHQQRGVQVRGGRPFFYTKQKVQDVKNFYAACCRIHKPPEPLDGALEVGINFYYPTKRPHKDGEPKTTRPDVDNMAKALVDVLTDLGFWHDDGQIAALHITKSYCNPSGVRVRIERITEGAWHK